jgi:hypothetical protein
MLLWERALIKGFSKVSPRLGRLGEVLTPERLAIGLTVVVATVATVRQIRQIREAYR